MYKRILVGVLSVLLLLAISLPAAAAPNARIGINVVLNTEVTDSILTDLEQVWRGTRRGL
jgi:hypothetical protein